MIKVAIFDLDSTLINTQKIKSIIFNLIKDVAEVDEDEVNQIYNRVRNKDGKVTFSLEKLKEELKKSVKNFEENKWKEFENNFESINKELLISGTEEIINFFRQNNIPIYILTLGVLEWQKTKVKLSGLDRLLGDNYNNIKHTLEEDTNKGKVNEIKEILKELNLQDCSDVLFFNDRPDETADIMVEFPSLRVFIRREIKDKRHNDNDFEKISKNKNVIKISEDLNIIEDIKKII